jgi:hypothetical protein
VTQLPVGDTPTAVDAARACESPLSSASLGSPWRCGPSVEETGRWSSLIVARPLGTSWLKRSDQGLQISHALAIRRGMAVKALRRREIVLGVRAADLRIE